jgi:hypothetical protein
VADRGMLDPKPVEIVEKVLRAGGHGVFRAASCS